MDEQFTSFNLYLDKLENFFNKYIEELEQNIKDLKNDTTETIFDPETYNTIHDNLDTQQRYRNDTSDKIEETKTHMERIKNIMESIDPIVEEYKIRVNKTQMKPGLTGLSKLAILDNPDEALSGLKVGNVRKFQKSIAKTLSRTSGDPNPPSIVLPKGGLKKRKKYTKKIYKRKH